MKLLHASPLLMATLLLLSLAPSQAAPKPRARAKAKPTLAPEQNTYIPKDLADSLATLRRMLKPNDLKEIRKAKEEDMVMYHHGLGTALRNEWGLWGGSRLAKYFNGLGVQHPDDMSGIILISLWRQLHSQPIRLEEQVRHYQNYWKAVRAADTEEKKRAAQAKHKSKRK